MKVVDQILLLKEWNKLLSVTLKRGEWIETWTASAWLFCCEGVAEGFTKDVYKKRSPPYGPWMSLNRAHCVISAQRLYAWAAHPLPATKCAWKGITKKKKQVELLLDPLIMHTIRNQSINVKLNTGYYPSSHLLVIIFIPEVLCAGFLLLA